MKRIEIVERDLTTDAVPSTSTDVVFVPGFSIAPLPPADKVADVLNGDTSHYGAPLNTPIYCEDVRTFEQYFGGRYDSQGNLINDETAATAVPVKFNGVPYFEEDQEYPSEFSSTAIPTVGGTELLMYESGMPDPGYIYARELVMRGFPVLYVRLNSGTYMAPIYSKAPESEIIYTKTEDVAIDPAKTYYTRTGSGTSEDPYVYSEVAEPVVADIGTYYEASLDPEKTYYTRSGEDPDYIYTKVTSPTVDDFDDYYEVTRQEPVVGNDVTVEDFYTKFQSYLENVETKALLEDKGQCDFKFLTSGGYPTFEYDENVIAKDMIGICTDRGDALALIDHTNNPFRTLNPTSADSVYGAINDDDTALGSTSYAALYTPWMKNINYSTYIVNDETFGSFEYPGSFQYLISYIKATELYPNWLAIAGVARGAIPNRPTPILNSILTNSIAENYQTDAIEGNVVSINPITDIKPYGQTIWGDRTLQYNSDKGSTTALSYVHIRNLVSDVKKQLYKAATKLMFEQNDDVLWTKFKGEISPLLDSMQSGQGIKGYKLIRNTTYDNNGNALRKTKLSCKVRIYPMYAVESFDIEVQLSDQDVSVE